MINTDKFYNLDRHYTFSHSAQEMYRIECERSKQKEVEVKLTTQIIDGRPQTRLSVFKQH